MPVQFVPAVKTHRVCAQQPFHPINQICSRRLHHQMKMIRHETKRVDLPGRLRASIGQRFEKRFAVEVVAENILATVAAAHDVIDRSGELNA